MEVTIIEMPKEGIDRVFKFSAEDSVLGYLYINKNHYIWRQDIFAPIKISKKTALNYFNNDKNRDQWPNL